MNTLRSLIALAALMMFCAAAIGAEADAEQATETPWVAKTTPAGYSIVTISSPKENGQVVQFGVGGIDFARWHRIRRGSNLGYLALQRSQVVSIC